MNYFEVAPNPGLKKYVQKYWSASTDALERRLTTLFPSGLLTISFDFIGKHYRWSKENSSSIPRSRLVGLQRIPYNFTRRGCWDSLHIALRPGYASALLKVPANKFVGRDIDLMDIWGPQVNELWEKLAETFSFSERVKIVEKELLKRLEKHHSLHPALEESLIYLENSSGPISVKDLAKHVNITPQHLRRIFKQYIGLGPKCFERISRFRKVLRKFKEGGYSNLTNIAYEMGYYDQAHMIHDFKYFTGENPLRFLQK